MKARTKKCSVLVASIRRLYLNRLTLINCNQINRLTCIQYHHQVEGVEESLTINDKRLIFQTYIETLLQCLLFLGRIESDFSVSKMLQSGGK
jgi:hypothetical protein